MKLVRPRLPRDLAAEIAALVDQLNTTGQRLEELTRGELDSVVDREGRAFLLPHAQAKLRASHEARQAAILDSLPAHVALLDVNGRIVSVNEGWREFGRANGLPAPGAGPGTDYLGICDAAAGEDAAIAGAAAAGIRAVLAGAMSTFSLEYPCDSPGAARWFQMTVTPLTGGSAGGAVVAHSNITERKLANRELAERERRFTDMLGNVQLVAVMVDREARVTYCNDYLLELTGWTRDEVIGQDWFVHFLPAGLRPLRDAFFASVLEDRFDTRHNENEIATRSGERRLIRWSNSVLRSHDGEVVGAAAIGEDITERKRAEVSIKRLNRVYAMLSGVNALIVRVRDRDELFREACRIATDDGRFRMALVVLAEAGKSLALAASAGKDGGLTAAVGEILADPDRVGKTMIARALRDRRPIVSNDSRADTQLVFSQAYADAGVRSVAVIPLLVGQEAKGVIALYSEEAGFFDDQEMALLAGLAGNIALAIEHIGNHDLLAYLAYYDALTGLANRTLFLERVAQALRAADAGGHKVALFLVDLERFKSINDSLGRPAGDELLRQVGQWLAQKAGDAGYVARVGADHFALMLPQVRPAGNLPGVVERGLQALLEHPFQLDATVLRIAAKAGVALYPDDGTDAETLFHNAEAALKKAKGSGEKYLFHTRRMTEAVAGKLTLENQLRQAVDKGEFVLHYQPKVSLASGLITGCEALIRWNDPRTGLVPPGQFIPVLEETGLIYEVGRWALRQALEDYLRWKAAGLPAPRVAVNISPLQLRRRGFVDEIRQAAGSLAGAAGALELELTESLIMEDVEHSIASLRSIRALGVKVAIDDFGTGFSSLSYLARLPVDTLKIDRSFVVDMTAGPQGLALVSTIINLAHSLKLNVVAEGVETQEQSRLLRLLGCDEMQGFLFGKPVPAGTYESLFLDPSGVIAATA